MKPDHELLGAQAYRRLKFDVLSGTLSPGARLSVDELAEKYGCSRTPVRQALEALSREGFVDILPRTGYFVSKLTVSDIRDIFGLRCILEAAAAELAASRITREQIERLEGLNTTFVHGDVESYVEYMQKNREFHHTIALSTGNRWLADSVVGLLDHMQRILWIRLDAVSLPDQEPTREHGGIIAALRDRDAERARVLVTQSIEKAEQDTLSAIIQGSHHVDLAV